MFAHPLPKRSRDPAPQMSYATHWSVGVVVTLPPIGGQVGVAARNTAPRRVCYPPTFPPVARQLTGNWREARPAGQCVAKAPDGPKHEHLSRPTVASSCRVVF